MTKYKWLLIISALLAGGLVAWWLHKPPPVAVDNAMEELRYEIEQMEERVNRIDQKVRKEVESIRATVKQEINTLDSGGVADALNAELAEFRRLEVPSGGISHP